MTIIRPRLNDFYGLAFAQDEVDFAIPLLDEDLPFYVDPFLLWKSPSLQDNSLHTAIVHSFNYLGYLVHRNKEREAIDRLIRISECRAVGLGVSKTRRGARISEFIASQITNLFTSVPQLRDDGFTHFEEIQLLVENVSKDRVSDIACNFICSFLIDYTIEQAEKYHIPVTNISSLDVYDYRTHRIVEEDIYLPINPDTGQPILLVPKRWLRRIPWINFEDYAQKLDIQVLGETAATFPNRVAILNYNRHNYDMVQTYVAQKEAAHEACKNDPLFTPLSVLSAKRKMRTILSLPTGKGGNADKKYEDNVAQLLASLLYPQLDFAAEQSRTDSNVLIRDLIFYNSRSTSFLQDIYENYHSIQIVFELKNTKQVDRNHINQLNRYLGNHLGHFGILVTRNPLPKNVLKNTIDLWSGQRKCIIALTDQDLELMVSVYESRQRLPIEVVLKKYTEFIRMCPS